MGFRELCILNLKFHSIVILDHVIPEALPTMGYLAAQLSSLLVCRRSRGWRQDHQENITFYALSRSRKDRSGSVLKVFK